MTERLRSFLNNASNIAETPVARVSPPQERSQLTRRSFLKTLGGVVGAGIYASTALPKWARAEWGASGAVTGELPLVEGLPEVNALMGAEFVSMTQAVGVRNQPLVIDNTLERYAYLNEVFQVVKGPVVVNGVEVPGGRQIEGTAPNEDKWTSVTVPKPSDTTRSISFVINALNKLPTYAVVDKNTLDSTIKAPYEALSIPAPVATSETSVDNAYTNSADKGELKGVDLKIAALWGDPIIKTPTTIAGRVVNEFTHPTRNATQEPVNAFRRMVGQAATSGYTEIVDVPLKDKKQASAYVKTFDLPKQGDQKVTGIDTWVRMGDYFVVTRATKIGDNGIPLVNGPSIGKTDWKGLVAYFGGDVQKATEVVKSMTNVGGRNPEEIIKQIGALPQSAVFIPVEGGGFAPKLDSTTASGLLGTPYIETDFRVNYSMTDGTPTASVSTNSSTAPSQLTAIKDAATGEWRWAAKKNESGTQAENTELPSWFGGFQIDMKTTDGKAIEMQSSPNEVLDQILTAFMMNGLQPSQYPKTQEELKTLLATYKHSVGENNGLVQGINFPNTIIGQDRKPPLVVASTTPQSANLAAGVSLDILKPGDPRIANIPDSQKLPFTQNDHWSALYVDPNTGGLSYVEWSSDPSWNIDNRALTSISGRFGTYLATMGAIGSSTDTQTTTRGQGLVDLLQVEASHNNKNPDPLRNGGVNRNIFVSYDFSGLKTEYDGQLLVPTTSP